MSSAATFSSSRCLLLVPGIGTTSSSLGEQPRQRQLRRRAALLLGRAPGRRSTSARFFAKFSPWKRGLCAPKSSGARSSIVLEAAREEAAAERAVRDERRCRAPAAPAAARPPGRASTASTRSARAAIGCTSWRAAASRPKAPTDRGTSPCLLHQIGHRTDRLLDRHARIDPMQVVEIDGVDAETLQRCVARLSSRTPRCH